MLDASLPLTVEERDEWGDPLVSAAAWAHLRHASPYEGLAAAPYPPMLLSCAENDPRVPFTQALRYVARLRHRSRHAARGGTAVAAPQLVHHLDVGGHQGEGGRFRRLEHAATELSFLLHAHGSMAY
eukprot:2417834-Prymnesium_polylepis.1